MTHALKCPKCHSTTILEFQDSIYGRPLGRYQCFICDYEWELPRVVRAWRTMMRKVRRWLRREHEMELPF